jgi:exodeoxyribonuclease VII large subunit
VLDEVAHMRYDTPSKVILGIEQVIARRAREAQASFSLVTTMAARIAERAGSAVDRLDSDVRSAAKATISDARSQTAAAMTDIRVESLGGLHRASANVDALQAEVRAGAKQHVGAAKSEVPAMLATVRVLAESSLDKARERIQGRLPAVLDRTQLDVRRARQGLAASVQEVLGGAGRAIEVQALMREIAGQGPAKTLKRGFAVVRSTDGKTVTSAQGAAGAGAIELTFADGRVRATAHTVQQREAPGAEPGVAPREINVGDE